MTLGPIQMIAMAFPGSKFTGDIRPRIAELVDQGIVNIVDTILIRKDADGTVDFLELQEITDDPDVTALSDFIAIGLDLVSDEDIEELAADLQPGSTAIVLVFEHTWMRPVRDAMAAAGGVLLADIHVPAEVVDEVLAAVAAS